MLFPNFVFFVCFVVKNNERTFGQPRIIVRGNATRNPGVSSASGYRPTPV
jgi:hypothetical protein